ncbi:MAG: aldehyde dehydrogenase family protein [Chloroflexi bacterium]|nr:aldehyde dehydrogenase family protein [Chloroflexota bacterium]MCY4247639.1 aldehyde dehydrogenase family protein [Chloroflexota bacterium]
MLTVADLFQSMAYGPAPEADAAADAWLDAHDRQFGLFINNAWLPSAAGGCLSVRNPAREQPLARVADASPADIDVAVCAARSAFASWSTLRPHQRARHLYAIARNIQKHARLLAVVESIDNGKPIREARDVDVPLAARHFYYHAGWAQLLESDLRDYQPLGVVGQVIPWNFPLLMLAWKIAPALAMGNTVVIKPAPYTPLSALLFAEIIAEAGLPVGVVNILTGGDAAGAALVAHKDLDKVAFTGSTAAGREIRRVTAGTGIKLTLELGGKSPYVVYDDADLDGAVEGLVDAIFFNQGEVCCAGSRLLVQETIAEAFLARLKRRMSHLRLGDALDKGIDIGAVVDPVQRATIDNWVQRGISEGAAIFQPSLDLPAQGCFYPPTLLTGLEAAAATAQEEIFGPVLVAMSFRTPAEAIELANNTRYGLAASVWSENISLALETARGIKAGSVWVNSANLFDAAAGFGGYRESGVGREGGKEGLFAYLRPRWQKRARPELSDAPADWGAHTPPAPTAMRDSSGRLSETALDRTAKLYIGGAQKRPDGNYTRAALSATGQLAGQVGDGSRKDIRNAVEAAHKAKDWACYSPHNRAQILYYIAENLSARQGEFTRRIADMTEVAEAAARDEVALSIERLFHWAALADKAGGNLQETTLRGLVAAIHEPVGVIGIACPNEAPLLAFVSLVAPAIARGNTVVCIPSQRFPLCATDLYQVLDTSDLPAGVVNIVTGDRDHLVKTLVEHDDVDSLWYFGDAEGSRQVEARSRHNIKRAWVNYGIARDWSDAQQGAGEEFLRESVEVKNIWVPTGF